MTGRRTSTAVVVAAALVASTIGLVVGSPSPALAAPPPAVGTVAIYAGAGFTPQGIALGSDGNLWFANYGSDGIGRITTAGVVTSFPGGGAISAPTAITPGPDGALWFTNTGTPDSIGRITTSGTISTFTAASIQNPSGIVAGSDNALWFTNRDANTIGRITTSGSVSSYSGTGINGPYGIAAGPDGALWFTNSGNSSIGRITTSGSVSSYPGTGINAPTGIAAGPDGALWFTNQGNSSIGRITTSGSVSSSTGTGIATPFAIASGPDGALWFTNPSGNSIGRITTAGVVSRFTGTGILNPIGIASGPDGNLWFTNSGGGSVGKIWAGRTPAAPSGASGVGGNSKVSVSWTAPPPDPTYPVEYAVSGYTVTASQGGVVSGPTCTATPPATTCDVTGLTNGTAYTFTVTATNVIGTGPASPPSSPVTPTQTAPAKPAAPTASAGPAKAKVDWVAPDDGGSPITGYTVTAAPGGATCTTTGATSCVVTGLDVTKTFTFTVRATNAAGTGPPSDPSAAVTFPPPVGTTWSFPDQGVDSWITQGPDGNLWYRHGLDIGRITPAGLMTTFPLTGVISGISGIFGATAGPDGNVWFTYVYFEGDGYKPGVGRISTAGDQVTVFPMSGADAPGGITAGPDGNLWVVVGVAIVRVTPQGVMTRFTGQGANTIGRGRGITAGPDGNLWFTDQQNSKIGRITTAGVITVFSGTGINMPDEIVTGPDGALWYTNLANSSIGRITTAGQASSYSDSTIVGSGGIAAGPDGALWFTSSINSSIGRITTAGQVSTYSGPMVVGPNDIAAGPDGNLWFTNASMPRGIGTIWPGRVPGAPTGVSGTAGDGRVSVSWSAPPPDPVFPTAYAVTGSTVTAHQGGVVSGQTCTATPPATTCDVTGLTNGTAYTFTVTATNVIGPSRPSAPSAPVTPVVGDLFHPLAAPTRILDSRPPPEQIGPYATPWTPGLIRDVPVAGGSTGVPAGATAVTLNVTVTGTTAASFLTLWPKGATQPTASNLNWVAGQTIPNAVTVKVGADGKVSVFNPSGNVSVIVDVVGYYDRSGTGDGFTAQAPARVLDSRPPPEQVGTYSTPWGPGIDRDVVVTGGSSGVPADADAVVANVTVTGTTAESFLTVYPNGATRPTASSVNWRAGQTIPNAVTVKVGTGGRIRVFNNSGNANVIIDVVGFFTAGTGDAFHPIDPKRVQDSRPAPETVGAYTTPWSAGLTRTVAVTTAGAVPAGAKAVLANVTVTGATAESFLTVWNTGAASRPTASSLNFRAGQTIANAVTAKVGTGDTISIYNNSGSVHVIADVAGWYG